MQYHKEGSLAPSPPLRVAVAFAGFTPPHSVSSTLPAPLDRATSHDASSLLRPTCPHPPRSKAQSPACQASPFSEAAEHCGRSFLATQSLKVASLRARQTRCSNKVSILSHVQFDRKVATDSVTLGTVTGSLDIVQRDSLCQEELPEGRRTQLKTRGHGRIVQMRKWRKKSSRYKEHRAEPSGGEKPSMI